MDSGSPHSGSIGYRLQKHQLENGPGIKGLLLTIKDEVL